MTDPDLNNKLDRLLTLLEAQLELTRQGHREERLQRAQLGREETMDLSHSEDQAGGGDESMIGDPHTPTPAPRPRRSVSFNLDEQEDINYEKYASPTGPRYVKTKLDPYSRTRTDPYPLDHEEDTSIMAELNRSKPIATPFPKFNPRDMEIFILEAEAWFKFNQVYEQSRMINHMGAQLEGTAREWWTSKLRIDRAREGRLFNDWHYFTERLSEQFNPRNARMEAYNKLLALRLTSDAPGAATRHVERFRDLEGQVNLDDNELVIDLFRGSLTRSIQEKFERNPPRKRWEWYREVEEIDRQRMLLQQSVRGLAPETQLGTININVMMTPRSGVSVDDDEIDGVGDEIGDVDDNEVDGVGDKVGGVDDNEVDGVGDKVGGVNTSVQCVDLMLEVIPGPQWTTAFGSIYIRTANLLWAPSDVR
ncbi:uncharacterized protein UHO2_00131 [Ustilago hordei]|uniref:uncharacterized protein n=1 Tax=Ustilago hordei TaxID=120017 RepID=UPI001A606E9F|nr:uncharacterized protein UHO2_00131 [Ustilago hordei]SYW81607.1 related to retrotransposon protein [Ustilago hordei]